VLLPFHGWKITEIAWGEIWIEFCLRLGKSGSVEPHQNIRSDQWSAARFREVGGTL
jgi:hypothetical protein